MANRTAKKFTEYFMVATGNQAIRLSGDYQNAGTLVDVTSGQLGVIASDLGLHIGFGTYLNATNNPAGAAPNTPQDVPKIRILQGTPAAANNAAAYGWPSQDKGWVWTPDIIDGEVMSVSTALPPVPTNSSVVLHTIPTPLASKKYAIFPKLRSVRNDRDFGANVEQFAIDHTMPATLPTAPLDYLLQNLAYKINVMSRLNPSTVPAGNRNILAFALDTDGSGAGTAIGTLAIGSTITVMTFASGATLTVTMDAALLQTMNRWIADTATNITASTEIVNINLSTAGGGTQDADKLVLMGLDHTVPAVYNGIPFTKTRVEATVGDEWYTGATLPVLTEAVKPVEDANLGSFLKYVWEGRAFGQSGLTQLAGHSDGLVTALEYIDESARYTVTTIDWQHGLQVQGGHNHEFQSRVWILLPASFTGANVTAGLTAATTATTTVSGLNTVLGTWLASSAGVKYLGAATAAAPFV